MNTGKVTHKHCLYHVTEKRNVENIKREGLKIGKSAAIYLSENPLSWWKPGMAILKVRITGLKDGITKVDENLDEFLYWNDIIPQRITEYVMGKKERKEAEEKYYSTHPK